MPRRIPNSRYLPWLLVISVLICLLPKTVAADDSKSIEGFRKAIIALDPSVDPLEAQMVSETSHHTARELQKNGAFSPLPWFKTFSSMSAHAIAGSVFIGRTTSGWSCENCR
jgi:hypothetical protein